MWAQKYSSGGSWFLASSLLMCLCVCVFSAAEVRQFPSKPLRESQSRLLTSTPSWTESDSATEKDKKGKITCHSFLLLITKDYHKLKIIFYFSKWWIFPPLCVCACVRVFRCQQPRDDHREWGVTTVTDRGDCLTQKSMFTFTQYYI